MYEVKRVMPDMEENIYHSVFNFFAYGLQPGSYTTYMLLHDFKQATHSAHPNLLRGPHDDMTTHEVLVYHFTDLPEFLTGENFYTWPGYVHLPEDKRQRILDSYSDKRIGEWKTYNAIGGKQEKSFRLWIDLAEAKLRIPTDV